VPRYRLTLAYDGTDFLGWQAQAAGRTVQGDLEAALARLAGGDRVSVDGAGRTDTGVHALGQVAAFDLPRAWDPATLQRALNALLGRDLRVLDAALAVEGFHPRRDAVGKLYRYQADLGPVQLPQRRRLAAHLPGALDAGRVREAAALFLGEHDFASLASSGSSVKTTRRTITRSEVHLDERLLTYEVEASGFLRKMVRSLVGGLLAAGRADLTPADLEAALLACDRCRWPPPAPACGLTLVRVDY
jgi:tRNA pseudouridine38-40 synthase